MTNGTLTDKLLIVMLREQLKVSKTVGQDGLYKEISLRVEKKT